MEILESLGDESLARVHIGSLGTDGQGRDRLVEFVESLQPPRPRDEKWVLIVSSLCGCPVDCAMCDAGGEYLGKLSAEEILAQADSMVYSRYPDGRVPARRFKVQFARMGEPAFNPAVLEALRALSERYDAPGLMPCLSTVAPRGRDEFFRELLRIKDEHYGGGRFQLQFSVHSTDESARDRLMPVRKWTLKEIAVYGEGWFRGGDRKVTLNFAAARGFAVDPGVLADIFDAEKFLVKLTPVNPTAKAGERGLVSVIDGLRPGTAKELVQSLEGAGFEVILSIGEMEENRIGSNCGQFVRALRRE